MFFINGVNATCSAEVFWVDILLQSFAGVVVSTGIHHGVILALSLYGSSVPDTTYDVPAGLYCPVQTSLHTVVLLCCPAVVVNRCLPPCFPKSLCSPWVFRYFCSVSVCVWLVARLEEREQWRACPAKWVPRVA
jgi:hypothetical protein